MCSGDALMKEAVVFEHVSYNYPGSTQLAVENVSFTIREGEFVLLTGPSGGGKSTLCRMINGLIPHFYGGRMQGRVLVYGMDTRETSVPELAKTVGFVFQNPENQIVGITVEEEVAFGLENMMVPMDEIKRRVDWALSLLGISHLRRRTTDSLSGGELQKVALASVLAMRPRILVLDEPTANLDPQSSRVFLETIWRLWREERKTIILVEHRLSEVLPMVSRVIVVDRKVIADGKPRELIEEGVLENVGVEEPPVSRLARKCGIKPAPLTVDEAAEVMRLALSREG